MAEVNVKKYVKLDGKWRFVSILRVSGKLKLTHILVDGRAVLSIIRAFYLEWRQDGKRVQRPVDTDARDALEFYRDQMHALASGEPIPSVQRPAKESVGIDGDHVRLPQPSKLLLQNHGDGLVLEIPLRTRSQDWQEERKSASRAR